MDKLARTFGLMEPLREARASGLPMFGSCAGMIMLADRIFGAIDGQESIGGLDISVERNAFGGQTESFETGIVIEGIREPDREFEGVFIRAPWVLEAGESTEVIARIRSGPHEGRIVGVRNSTLMATSFHPELTADPRVHELFVEMVRNS
jgi:5'-phosphate synthase pdxT subunit